MRQAVSSLQAFYLLSPQGMRASSRIGRNVGLGADGGQIAAFIAAMSDEVKVKLLERLQAFFPSVMGLRIRKKQGGYCELRIRQRFGTTEIETEASRDDPRYAAGELSASGIGAVGGEGKRWLDAGGAV